VDSSPSIAGQHCTKIAPATSSNIAIAPQPNIAGTLRARKPAAFLSAEAGDTRSVHSLRSPIRLP
jgi:hypothetical protein